MADADADESISNRTFILIMDKAVPSDVEVNYVLSGSALNPDDFSDVTAAQGVATIPQGSTTTTINLSIVDDNVVEANETIVASLQATTSSAVVTADTTPATLTIIDNDEILVSITGDTEADEAVSTRNFTISLAEPASIDVLIDYTLSGTALNFDDFTDLSGGSVLIPIGSTATTINIEVIDDSLVENAESIQATISSSLGAVTITQATAMLNILDNDMCTPPANLEVTDIQIATVDLSWSMPTDVSFVGFEWVIMNAGDDPLTAVPVAFDFTLDNVTNVADAGVLVKDTSYDFYVRTMCTSDVYSAFNGPITFNTLPDNDDDGIPDGIDEDDDNDGISDLEEGKGDCDNDGIPDDFDPDACTITTNDIATAFTPNGDNLNDTWVIKGIENFPNSVVSVFNRWGHEVFKAQGYQNDWSAAYKDNSRMLPPGSYYFVINLGDGTKPIDGWLFINY